MVEPAGKFRLLLSIGWGTPQPTGSRACKEFDSAYCKDTSKILHKLGCWIGWIRISFVEDYQFRIGILLAVKDMKVWKFTSKFRNSVLGFAFGAALLLVPLACFVYNPIVLLFFNATIGLLLLTQLLFFLIAGILVLKVIKTISNNEHNTRFAKQVNNHKLSQWIIVTHNHRLRNYYYLSRYFYLCSWLLLCAFWYFQGLPPII